MTAQNVFRVCALGAFTLVGCGAFLGDLSERTTDVAPVDAATESDTAPPREPAEAGDARSEPMDACVAEPLTVTCAQKACGPAKNNCDGDVTCPDTCKDGLACGSGGANVCGPPSCAGTGPGVSACGVGGAASCCATSTVPGATYNRAGSGAPATVASFQLDHYEVTVGRFRKFVTAVVAGYLPPAASGRHPNGVLNGGSEVGWNALEWNAYIPTTAAKWNEVLSCRSGYSTWTAAPGATDNKPQNCANWYQLHAFCIWDGGFLPTEAEWQLAATEAGQRTYPWAGGVQPSANADLGAWGCFFNGTGTCSGTANIAPVGIIAAGVGAYGQSDLGGNLYEWTLDAMPASYGDCLNCANLPSGSPTSRNMRGGSFRGDFSLMQGASRNLEDPRGGSDVIGARCARKP